MIQTYITEHGLRFNTSKMICVTFGKSHFENPIWHLNTIWLPVRDELNYLESSQKRCLCFTRKWDLRVNVGQIRVKD